MIKKLEVSGQHTTVTRDLQKYISKKLAHLDKYVARHARESVHAEVKLKEAKAKDKKQFTCEVVLRLPHETMSVSETTINMFAAVDIVEAKLKTQLKRYKDQHGDAKLYRRMFKRLRGRALQEAAVAAEE